MRHCRATGHGTDSGKFNYGGEAHKIFLNSIIETGVLRVLGGWSVHMFFCIGVIDGAQQCNVGRDMR